MNVRFTHLVVSVTLFGLAACGDNGMQPVTQTADGSTVSLSDVGISWLNDDAETYLPGNPDGSPGTDSAADAGSPPADGTVGFDSAASSEDSAAAPDTAVQCTESSDCDDDNPCTVDKCTDSKSCTNTILVGIGCSDGELCTYDDSCQTDGACRGKPISCNDDPGICGANRTCDGTAVCKVAYPGPTVGCDDGQACTMNDSCDGSGSCTGTPTGTDWVRVTAINFSTNTPAWGWAAEQIRQWQSDRQVKRARVLGGVSKSGDHGTGGYCFASWSTGHIEGYMTGAKDGYYNVDGKLYPWYDDAHIECPTYPPVFSSNGVVQICQESVAVDTHVYQYGTREAAVDLPVGTTMTVKARHVQHDSGGNLACYLEVKCQ